MRSSSEWLDGLADRQTDSFRGRHVTFPFNPVEYSITTKSPDNARMTQRMLTSFPYLLYSVAVLL